MNPKIHSISQADLDALPTPIAVPANRYAQETDVRIKLALMIDTIETVFKYGSAIVVQVMRQRSDWLDFVDSPPRKSILKSLQLPQLGEHVGIISSAYYYFRNTSRTLPLVLESVCKLTQKHPSDLSNELKRLRNRRKGHGAWPSEDVARSALCEFGGAFSDTLQIAIDLNRTFPLYLEPASIRFSGPIPPKFEKADGEENEVWRLVIYDDTQQWSVGLYPLLLCGRDGSTIFNGEGDSALLPGGVTFLDYCSGDDLDLKVGHRIVEDFKSAFSLDGYRPQFDEYSVPIDFFTGRESDLQILTGFLQQDDDRILLVRGERGIGKSTLLEKWWRDLDSQGFSIARHIVTEGSPNAEPREVASHLLRQLDGKARPEFDWNAEAFHREIANLLQISHGEKPWLILLDGIDECAAYLERKGRRDTLFDWIPSPGETGPGVFWILGARSPYAAKKEVLRQLGSQKLRIHDVLPFGSDDVAAYLCHFLDGGRVHEKPSLLPLVLERTRGLPLSLYLFATGIQNGISAYNEDSIRAFTTDKDDLIRKGVDRLPKAAEDLEEALRRDEFVFEERALARKALSASQYRVECDALKTAYRRQGALYIENLLALLGLTEEPLTEGTMISILELPGKWLPCYLSLVSPYIREEQDGFTFLHDAFRDFILHEKTEWVGTLRKHLLDWCLEPANRGQGYVIRNGVSHLLAAYREEPTEANAERIATLLTDIGFITTKIRAGLIAELLRDYREVLAAMPENFAGMFADLESDDEDRTWLVEARRACLEGKESPYPDRGGAGVIAKCNELNEISRAARAANAQEIPNRNDEDEEGNGALEAWEKFTTFWDDSPATPSDAKFEEITLEAADEEEESDEEKIRERRQWDDDNQKNAAETEAKRHALARTFLSEDTVTDRAIRKMHASSSVGKPESAAERISAFEALAMDCWSLIQNEKTDIGALCYNHRQSGIIHDSGEAFIKGDSQAWIELLNRPDEDVRRLRLPFQGARILPFAQFTQFLLIESRKPKSADEFTHTFTRFDARANQITGNCTGHSASHHSSRFPMVSDDGRHVRLGSNIWELDFESGTAKRLEPGQLPDLPAELMADPPFDRPTQPSTDYRPPVFSEDGFLTADADSCGVDLFETISRERVIPANRGYDNRFTDNKGGKPREIFFAANGHLLVGRNSHSVVVLHLPSGELLFEEQRGACEVSATRDGRLLAILRNSEVTVWDVFSGMELRRFATQAHGSGGLRFSESGELLQVNSEIVDLRSGSRVPRFDEPNGGNELVERSERFSIEKDKATDLLTFENLTANNGALSLRQFHEGEPSLLLAGDQVIALFDSSYGIASYTIGGLMRHTFEMEDLMEIRPEGNDNNLPHSFPALLPPYPFSSCGSILIAANNGSLGILNPTTGEKRIVNSFKFLAELDKTVGQRKKERYIESPWEARRRAEDAERGHGLPCDEKPYRFEISDALPSIDGAWILTATNWDGIRIWNVENGECERVLDLPAADSFFAGIVEKLVLSRDGNDCYLALQDGSIHVWRNWLMGDQGWSKVHHFHVETECYCILPASRRFMYLKGDRSDVRADRYGAVHEIYDLETGTPYPFTPAQQFFDMDELVAMTPDGQHLLFSSAIEGKENYLRVLRLGDFEEVMRFPMRATITAVSNIADDGRFVVLTDNGDLLRLKIHFPH